MPFLRDTPQLRLAARWATRVWAAAILIACLWPGENIPEVDVPLADKWVHFVLFGTLAFLQALAAAPFRWGHVLLTGVVFGIGVEGLQAISHPWLHRYGDVSDAVADALGTVIGLLAFLALQRLRTPTARS